MERGPYKGKYRQELYDIACELRRAYGYGYRTIAHHLNGEVTWPTVRNWVRYIEVDPSISRNLSTKFFTAPYKPFEELKTNRSLREFLIREQGHICSWCKNTEWLGKPIPLELDHIDGVRDNSDRSNLRLLCPNCHSQTPTYKGKNMKKNLKSVGSSPTVGTKLIDKGKYL